MLLCIIVHALYDTDPGGTELVNHPSIASAAACHALCLGDSTCFTWVWSFNDDTCSIRGNDFKSNVLHVFSANIVSCTKLCNFGIDECIYFDMASGSGANLEDLNFPSMLLCQQACDQNPACQWS